MIIFKIRLFQKGDFMLRKINSFIIGTALGLVLSSQAAASDLDEDFKRGEILQLKVILHLLIPT